MYLVRAPTNSSQLQCRTAELEAVKEQQPGQSKQQGGPYVKRGVGLKTRHHEQQHLQKARLR